MPITVYWAGPLFTQAERVWNRRCVKELERKGYDVVLPQDEARRFITPTGIDAAGIAESCYQQVIACDVVVAVLDGCDSDSGTSLEVGLRIGHMRALRLPSKVIGMRTDFRAAEDGQLNAMFRLVDGLVSFPSFEEDEAALCVEIDTAIQRACGL